MDTTAQQTPRETVVSTEDYWAQVQTLRDQLAQLRPEGQRA